MHNKMLKKGIVHKFIIIFKIFQELKKTTSMYYFRFYSATFFYMNQQEILTIPRDSDDGSRSLLKMSLYIVPQSSFLNYTTEGS